MAVPPLRRDLAPPTLRVPVDGSPRAARRFENSAKTIDAGWPRSEARKLPPFVSDRIVPGEVAVLYHLPRSGDRAGETVLHPLRRHRVEIPQCTQVRGGY